MRDVMDAAETWLGQGQPLALATVVETWGSAPRGVGARMVVSAGGQLAGSVSGGCVEAAVVDAARQVLRGGPPRLLHFGVADETAWAVGLACGGSIDVFVEGYDVHVHEAVRALLAEDALGAIATVVSGRPETLGRKLVLRPDAAQPAPAGDALDETLLGVARDTLAEGRSRRVDVPATGVEIFVELVQPRPRLVIVGGVHIAVALSALARTLGYVTMVVDPRPAFGSEQRFPHADRVWNAWPDDALREIGLTSRTAVALLTHDPKLDDPALRVALRSPAFYVGALGGKATQAQRRQRLLDAGFGEGELARLRAPIGLDLGGRSPEEIALAVMGQIVAVRNGRG